MQESAQAAFTYLKTKMKELGISKKKLNESDIHIHVPEGATPKDGPSAGIAICTALISAFTKIPVKQKIAMTGEITLQGRILPIGGIKEKILAAELQEYSLVILPEENRANMEEIISEIGNLKLKIVYFNHMDQVIEAALKKNIFNLKKEIK
jgi:ATP-dependent Lon protease